MHKVIDIGSWSGPGFEQPVTLLKVSSRGLIGNDRRDFLKVASHVFASAIDSGQVRLQPGDLPIHLNAIGATEGYSANRNGDAFSEKTCRAQHDTFVKSAKLYKNHKNNDPSKSYGYVKLSAYNDRMRRIELLVMASANKEAAERDGGLVLDGATIDKLNDGESINFSMACRLPYDVCNNCFNKAANRSQYCTASSCVNPDTGRRGLGCKDGLTKVAADGIQQFVENPGAHFFDISHVARPADRIASGALADYLTKVAADGRVVGGAELAELYGSQLPGFSLLAPTDTLFFKQLPDLLKIARQLADEEHRLSTKLGESDIAVSRGIPTAPLPMDWEILPAAKAASMLRALAEQGIAMSVEDFLHSLGGKSAAALATIVKQHLPGVYTRLLEEPDELSRVKRAGTMLECPTSRTDRELAQRLKQSYSLLPSALRDRVVRSAVHQQPDRTKQAAAVSQNPHAENLAREYAAYKLAFLSVAPIADRSALVSMVARQHYLV